MLRPPQDSAYRQQRRELTLQAQHQGSPWAALLNVYQLAPLLAQEAQFMTMQIVLVSEVSTKATALPPSSCNTQLAS